MATDDLLRRARLPCYLGLDPGRLCAHSPPAAKPSLHACPPSTNPSSSTATAPVSSASSRTPTPWSIGTTKSTTRTKSQSATLAVSSSPSGPGRRSAAISVRRVIGFPMLVHPRFVTLVEEEQPRALVILAHYFALVARLRGLWWMGDSGRREVLGIQSALPEEWQDAMQWPLESIADEGNVIAMPGAAMNAVVAYFRTCHRNRASNFLCTCSSCCDEHCCLRPVSPKASSNLSPPQSLYHSHWIQWHENCSLSASHGSRRRWNSVVRRGWLEAEDGLVLARGNFGLAPLERDATI